MARWHPGMRRRRIGVAAIAADRLSRPLTITGLEGHPDRDFPTRRCLPPAAATGLTSCAMWSNCGRTRESSASAKPTAAKMSRRHWSGPRRSLIGQNAFALPQIRRRAAIAWHVLLRGYRAGLPRCLRRARPAAAYASWSAARCAIRSSSPRTFSIVTPPIIR